MIGRVVSTKMEKTVSVLVESTKRHPLYKKSYVSSKKYLAQNDLKVKEGDIVELLKVAPISKNKHWKIAKVLGRDIVALGEESLKQSAQAAIEEVMPEESQESEVISPEPAIEADLAEKTEKVKPAKPKKKTKTVKKEVKS